MQISSEGVEEDNMYIVYISPLIFKFGSLSLAKIKWAGYNTTPTLKVYTLLHIICALCFALV